MLRTTKARLAADYKARSGRDSRDLVDLLLSGVPADAQGNYAWVDIVRHCGIPRWQDHLYEVLTWQDRAVCRAWLRSTASWARPFASWAVEQTGRDDVRALLPQADAGASAELSGAIIAIRGAGLAYWSLLDTALLAVTAVAHAHVPDPGRWDTPLPTSSQVANQMALCAGCSLHGRAYGWTGDDFNQWALLLPLVS